MLPAVIMGAPGLGVVKLSRGARRTTRGTTLSQALPQSGGAIRFGADYYYRDDLIPLTWSSLPEAEVELVEGLLLAAGCSTPFIYTDAAGVGTWVYFAEPRIAHREVAPGRRSLSLVLKVV